MMTELDILYTKVIHQFSAKIVYQTVAAGMKSRRPIWDDKQIINTFLKISTAFEKSYNTVKSDVKSTIETIDTNEMEDIIDTRIKGLLH